MPLPKDKEHVDQEALSNALMSAANMDKSVVGDFGYRIAEVDNLEDEIIKNYANNHAIKLSTNPSLLECIVVQTEGQALLNRITEIELTSVRIAGKIRMKREAILNLILNALGTSGSAESRRAKAAGGVEAMNALIAVEERLLMICETVRKNIKSAIDVASRSQTALQHEIQYLGGAEVAQELVSQTRGKFK